MKDLSKLRTAVTYTYAQEPVRLVQFWPDHFFGDSMKFIIDIVNNYARASLAPIVAGPLQKSFLHPC